MKKTKAPSTTNVKHSLSKVLYRYHVVLFVVIVIGGMAVVVFLLNQTIQAATDTSQIIPQGVESFDQETIDRLNDLTTSSQITDIKFPQGRINPFSE